MVQNFFTLSDQKIVKKISFSVSLSLLMSPLLVWANQTFPFVGWEFHDRNITYQNSNIDTKWIDIPIAFSKHSMVYLKMVNERKKKSHSNSFNSNIVQKNALLGNSSHCIVKSQVFVRSYVSLIVYSIIIRHFVDSHHLQFRLQLGSSFLHFVGELLRRFGRFTLNLRRSFSCSFCSFCRHFRLSLCSISTLKERCRLFGRH